MLSKKKATAVINRYFSGEKCKTRARANASAVERKLYFDAFMAYSNKKKKR